MIRTTLTAAGAALAFSLVGACGLVPSLSVTPRLGTLQPKGNVAAADSTVGISVSSDIEDLGLDSATVFQPRVDFSWGPFDLMGSYDAAEYSGDGVATADLDLGGIVISAGDPVSSDLDVTTINLIGTFDFIPGDLIDLGIGVGARSIDFRAVVESQATGNTIVSDETFVLPVAAARVGMALGDFRVSAIGSGLTGSYDGIDATVLDVDVMATYTFDFAGFFWGVVAGYRYIQTELDYEDSGSDVDVDLTFDGPYFGLTLGI